MPDMWQTSKNNQAKGKDRLPVCAYCKQTGHTQFYCRTKPRKGLNAVGRVGKRTNVAVAKWKRTQRPNHQGYYQCYICGKWVTYLEAEHVKSKVRHPDRRTDTTNLRPVCDECNANKGSKDGEEP